MKKKFKVGEGEKKRESTPLVVQGRELREKARLKGEKLQTTSKRRTGRVRRSGSLPQRRSSQIGRLKGDRGSSPLTGGGRPSSQGNRRKESHRSLENCREKVVSVAPDAQRCERSSQGFKAVRKGAHCLHLRGTRSST